MPTTEVTTLTRADLRRLRAKLIRIQRRVDRLKALEPGDVTARDRREMDRLEVRTTSVLEELHDAGVSGGSGDDAS